VHGGIDDAHGDPVNESDKNHALRCRAQRCDRDTDKFSSQSTKLLVDAMSERLGQFFTPAKQEDKCDNRDRHDKCVVRNEMADRLKRMKQRTVLDAAEQGRQAAGRSCRIVPSVGQPRADHGSCAEP
jgi:hypothetical protein